MMAGTFVVNKVIIPHRTAVHEKADRLSQSATQAGEELVLKRRMDEKEGANEPPYQQFKKNLSKSNVHSTNYYYMAGLALGVIVAFAYLYTQGTPPPVPTPPLKSTSPVAPIAPGPGTSPKEDWGNRTVALEKARNWQGLLAHCRRWTQSKPGDFLAWHSLGVAYGRMGRYPEAIEAYREAVRLKPDDVVAWNNLALSYALSGNGNAALEALRELRRYDPKKAEEISKVILKP